VISSSRGGAAAGHGERSGCTGGWASVRVALPGEHGCGTEWWLGARARVQGTGLARLAARLGRGGAGLRMPSTLGGGGGGGTQLGRASGKGTVGLVSFSFLFFYYLNL
jgi:hypothetical protein